MRAYGPHLSCPSQLTKTDPYCQLLFQSHAELPPGRLPCPTGVIQAGGRTGVSASAARKTE
ncbi:MAG: hypothetical protein ACK2TU_09545 [Anaerolineales bacterium]